MRSSMDLIAAVVSIDCIRLSRVTWVREKAGARTVELLEALEDAGGTGGVAGLLLVGSLGLRVACARVNGSP